MARELGDHPPALRIREARIHKSFQVPIVIDELAAGLVRIRQEENPTTERFLVSGALEVIDRLGAGNNSALVSRVPVLAGETAGAASCLA